MGTDHTENGTRGKHCTATCVHETRTPKPRTDTTQALKKNLQTTCTGSSKNKHTNPHARSCTGKKDKKQKVLADQLT